jgi:lauroyl/myristoyl acyltransferase
MKALLKRNQLVSVTVGKKSRKTAELAFLNGRICLATGALNLAAASKAVVLPVFTVRKSDREFEVVIDAPLSFDLPCNRHESIEVMLRRYVQRLESYVSEHPGQWLGWDELFQAPADNAPPSPS